MHTDAHTHTGTQTEKKSETGQEKETVLRFAVLPQWSEGAVPRWNLQETSFAGVDAHCLKEKLSWNMPSCYRCSASSFFVSAVSRYLKGHKTGEYRPNPFLSRRRRGRRRRWRGKCFEFWAFSNPSKRCCVLKPDSLPPIPNVFDCLLSAFEMHPQSGDFPDESVHSVHVCG